MSVWALSAAVVVGAAAAALGARRLRVLRDRRRYAVREHPGFLSDAECAHLIERARPCLQQSAVIRGGRRGARDARRDSGSAFLDQAGDRVVQDIKRRIAALTDTRVAQQERIQVTHYGEGERFAPHLDSLAAAGRDPGEAGDRICTVILYLNDDYEGGATWFPRIARRVRPEKGKAVVFGNLCADGSRADPLALHSGEPVRRGEKWLSNQWIRQRDRWAGAATRGKARGGRRRRVRSPGRAGRSG